MLKRTFAIVFVILSVAALFCGCTSAEERQAKQEQREAQREQQIAAYIENLREGGWRQMIDIIPQADYLSQCHLVYDAETYVIYYKMEFAYDRKAAAYLCPFYSENGYLCRYNPDTAQIEEIIH